MPMALGNMPQEDKMHEYEKVAFMGQVPTRVLGEVSPGDYILPSGLGNGFARAIRPEHMKIGDYKKIAGVVWSVDSKLSENISMVNVAVGINTHDLADVIQGQQEELATLRTEYAQLKKQVDATHAALAELVPGFAEATGFDGKATQTTRQQVEQSQPVPDAHTHVLAHDDQDIVYFTISRAQVEASFEIAREQYQEMLHNPETRHLLANEKAGYKNMVMMPVDQHPFWQKLESDPQYREEIIQFVQKKFEKAVHTHRQHAHKFTDLERID